MKKASVLIVDDEEFMRQMLISMLEGEGYSCLEAENGREGLEAFEKYRPDIVLLDDVMPEMNGLEMLKQIRGQGQYNRTYIIILSVFSEVENREKAFYAGADDYLIKPFHQKELLARIYAGLRRIQDLQGGQDV